MVRLKLICKGSSWWSSHDDTTIEELAPFRAGCRGCTLWASQRNNMNTWTISRELQHSVQKMPLRDISCNILNTNHDGSAEQKTAVSALTRLSRENLMIPLVKTRGLAQALFEYRTYTFGTSHMMRFRICNPSCSRAVPASVLLRVLLQRKSTF